MSNLPPLPSGFIEQLAPLLGDRLPDFLHSYEEAPCRGVRMRPGLPPIPDASGSVPWAEKGYYLPLSSNAGAVPLHDAGAYYLQEPSAMAAAAALHPLPGEKVLDLCAAPGGKSTQLASSMQGMGLLVCNEPVAGRAAILSRNIERMGVTNALVISALPEEISGKWPSFFDIILVDAPCSGEGMFRRHPETRLEWRPASPPGCAQRQEHILRHAARMLRPGGMLAYSTCTFNPIENEGVIQHFLGGHPEFSLVPIALPGLPQNDGMLHLWPHEIRGEGHFVALLQKTDGDAGRTAAAALAKPGKQEAQAAADFLREHLQEKLTPNAQFAGHLVLCPQDLPPIDHVKVLRLGLHLGDMKGKTFIPDHAVAMACASLRPLAVTEDQARRYQAGEVLTVPESCKGFYVPVLDGVALGWGKASDGQLKNHYPKGLRR